MRKQIQVSDEILELIKTVYPGKFDEFINDLLFNWKEEIKVRFKDSDFLFSIFMFSKSISFKKASISKDTNEVVIGDLISIKYNFSFNKYQDLFEIGIIDAIKENDDINYYSAKTIKISLEDLKRSILQRTITSTVIFPEKIKPSSLKLTILDSVFESGVKYTIPTQFLETALKIYANYDLGKPIKNYKKI